MEHGHFQHECVSDLGYLVLGFLCPVNRTGSLQDDVSEQNDSEHQGDLTTTQGDLTTKSMCLNRTTVNIRVN